MKSNLTLLTIFFLLLMTTLGCKKDKDYRNAYTGNYNFIVDYRIYYSPDSVKFDTVINYEGTISKGQSNNDIIIQFLANNYIDGILSETGQINKISGTGLGWSFSGYFYGSDKISVFISYLNGYSYQINGDKR